MPKPQPKDLSSTEVALLEMMEHLSKDRAERESLARRMEIDELRLELAAIRTALSRLEPRFDGVLREAHEELREKFDPDSGKRVSPS